MNLRYLSGALISLPLLPLMYLHGKRIKASIPQLPEAAGSEGEHHNNLKKPVLRLLFIGESTIAGVGVKTHEEGFTGTFAKEISSYFKAPVQWKVYARSGYTAQRVDEKIIPKISEESADLIVIGIGGNDAFTLNRPSKWNAATRSLIQSLRSKFPAAIVVFCNMPPIKEFPAFTPLIKFTVGNLVEILGDELQQTVRSFPDVYYFEKKITLERWTSKFQLKAKKEDFFSDGIHPSKLTYQTWAKDVAQEVCENETIKKALENRKASATP